ncbi:MAG: DsbC family protein [Ramlibacter sp.]|nr:DsbC family protein [Ramlibacter sp.]
MKLMIRPALAAFVALMALTVLAPAMAQTPAQEAAIRKNLNERLPRLGKIDEISTSPISGLFEIRVGPDIYYTDPEGNFMIQGAIIDTKQKKNLTEERQEKLLALDFAKLPLNDAFTIVRGNGSRKLAMFEDPNCGYCKRFERDLQKIDNVTVHVFLLPILGPDSVDKSRNLWCSADKGKAWLDWMLRNVAAPKNTCDASALARNIEFGKTHRISGTPTLFFANGTRVPGAITAADIEKLLADAK